MIVSALSKALDFIGVRVLAGLLAAAILGLGLQTCRLDSAVQNAADYKSERDSAKVELDEAVAANGSNLATIDELRQALATCKTNREADAVANAEAVANLTDKAAKLETRLADMKRDRENQYETDAEYRAWADELVPLSTDRRMRELAASGDEDGDGRD